jgi:uncharacterized phiE125 gp8 family phage protein
MGTSLITLAEYKNYVGITSPTQDTIINSLIPKVSQLVKTYCRRTFVDYYEDSKVEVFSGGTRLNLGESPVVQIQSVEYSADYGNTYSSLTEYTDWVLDTETEEIVPLFATGEFKKSVNGYKVTYTAGYEEIPEDLKLAVLDLVSYYIKNDSAIHSTKSPGSNTTQIEFISTTSLPSHIKRVLDLYVLNYN